MLLNITKKSSSVTETKKVSTVSCEYERRENKDAWKKAGSGGNSYDAYLARKKGCL